MPPPKLAAALAETPSALPMVAWRAGGPGIVNLRLRETSARSGAGGVRAGVAYGDSTLGGGLGEC